MKTKTIKIPIFCAELTMHFDRNLKAVSKLYDTKSLANYGAVTLKNEKFYRHYVVAFESKQRSTIAHEIVHIINYIYLDCGIELDRVNDENQAYLTGWLFSEIEEFLYK